MSRSIVKQMAEAQTAKDLGLTETEVRAYVLSTATPFDRQKLRHELDWMEVDAVARRGIKKVSKAQNVSAKEASYRLGECFAYNFQLLEQANQERPE